MTGTLVGAGLLSILTFAGVLLLEIASHKKPSAGNLVSSGGQEKVDCVPSLPTARWMYFNYAATMLVLLSKRRFSPATRLWWPEKPMFMRQVYPGMSVKLIYVEALKLTEPWHAAAGESRFDGPSYSPPIGL
jgi:hypothetical protein